MTRAGWWIALLALGCGCPGKHAIGLVDDAGHTCVQTCPDTETVREGECTLVCNQAPPECPNGEDAGWTVTGSSTAKICPTCAGKPTTPCGSVVCPPTCPKAVGEGTIYYCNSLNQCRWEN